MEQYPSKSQHLLLPTGHRSGPLFLSPAEVREKLKDLAYPTLYICFISPVDEGAHDEVLVDGHVGEDALSARKLLDTETRTHLG
tara:strand:- start:81 stop:332 length:252 start_codon:yes stop_codon:yes gene_type:complete